MQDVHDEPLFVQRVAGLDIAKAEVEVTIRVPSDTVAARRQQETRTFGTTSRQLRPASTTGYSRWGTGGKLLSLVAALPRSDRNVPRAVDVVALPTCRPPVPASRCLSRR